MIDPTSESPAAISDQPEISSPVVLPLSISPALESARPNPTSSARLILDDRALARLLEIMIRRSGLSLTEVAEQMGIGRKAVEKYVYRERTNPSLKWLLRFAGVCGAELTISFPVRTKE